MTFEISFMETICLAWISWRWWILRILPWGFITIRKSKLGWLNWNLQETNLTEDLKPHPQTWWTVFFPTAGIWISLHIQQPAVANPSKWILFKSPNAPSSFFSKCLAPTSKDNGQGALWCYLRVAGWGGFCFAPAIQWTPPNKLDGWYNGFWTYTIYKWFLLLLGRHVQVSMLISEKKNGTFLVADHHIRRLWRRWPMVK